MRWSELGQTLVECLVIAPDDIVRFLRERLDAMAAENFVALCVKSVRPARNGPHRVNKTCARIFIEQRTNYRPRLLSGIADALSQPCVHRALNQKPLTASHARHRRQMPAAIVAAFPAWPVAMSRGDLFRTRPNLLLNLIEPRHLLH